MDLQKIKKQLEGAKFDINRLFFSQKNMKALGIRFSEFRLRRLEAGFYLLYAPVRSNLHGEYLKTSYFVYSEKENIIMEASLFFKIISEEI